MTKLNFLPTASRKLAALTMSAAFVALTAAQPVQADEQIHILGWLEHANVTSVDIRMDAKLDTGAKTSAIHAEILSRKSLDEDQIAELREETDDDEEVLAADGAEEVALDLQGRPRRVVFRVSNEEGEERILEREIVRYVSIKKRSGGLEVRPVIELDLCLAGIKVSGEVSLADRTRFNYPLLVGRDMLEAGHIAVNPDVDYTASARC